VGQPFPGPVGPGEDRGLGQHLGLRGRGGQRAGLDDPRERRLSGAWIEQVVGGRPSPPVQRRREMPLVAAAPPTSPKV
jgi:hypothetical protein